MSREEYLVTQITGLKEEIDNANLTKIGRLLYVQKRLMQMIALAQDYIDVDNTVSPNFIVGSSEWKYLVSQSLAAVKSEASEANELLNPLGRIWKQKKELDLGELKEEIVDVLFFFLQTAAVVFDDSFELEQIYKRKYKKNLDRILQTIMKNE